MNINILIEYEKLGKLKRSKHPNFDLYIWNYSEKVQYNKEWDPITLKCRGLVTDFQGNIVAHSFNKFFNLEEQKHISDPIKDNFKVYEKLDGSLGILFYYTEWIFASRGSFTSVQAIKGKNMLHNFDLSYFDKNLTYIFEIIYPENRIVVNYNDKESLIFLAAFDKTGKEYDVIEYIMSLNIEVVKEYTKNDPFLLKAQDTDNKEGYVIKFDNGERIKIKFDNYIKLHKTISNLTIKNVFEWIKNGENIDNIIEKIPDEYHSWFNKIKTTTKKVRMNGPKKEVMISLSIFFMLNANLTSKMKPY